MGKHNRVIHKNLRTGGNDTYFKIMPSYGVNNMGHPEEVNSLNGHSATKSNASRFESNRIPTRKNKKVSYELSKKKLADHFMTQYGRDGEELSPKKIHNDSKKEFFSPRSAEINR